ncbi:enterobactin non-ribosomal peptide synthetase EntF [Klebsiella quasipneumoniae subsp. similipneumoniae]|uniref:Enterobactin non-ribosomal peptide synthetase EntF n=1 Tax=Klebsiella quasipneumoniae TaxID=1463165 RepID=A0A8G2ECP7_9ENTR|nr:MULTISPECIES: enterobactin non-ribosomal peptide synthetase EntF [Klebsiella]AZJ06035.1 enterobactin non-ribosomal peptide synthetase EntF [Klebsiella quasipneumoniae]AZJ29019.1 enterobactin non-ribosomal peptide synthetase EntF [Klebsiella quasipneumoniae subsp. similipneumoniae]ELC0922862.1 enterobactin non-ribosomal peptide synthetase EntF [Klebsiella quasipneumoniae]MBC5047242.1 enterobactin non-ribosomal peptide synthetase EntF [Klebsiella quasipneumoniae]MCW9388150.1 enterobactin non-
MTTRLPLVAAQPGIWMAERLSTLPGAWSVAHYVELRGALDPALLGKAIVAGLQQADTLSLRFEEQEGEVWQWVAAERTFAEPPIIDLRTTPDPHRAATERMQADLAQDLRVDGGNPLVCHQLLRVGDDRWYWYQRYHHLLVDGFSFPAITRQIAAIYRAWQRGEATPESPFTSFAEVVDEYQRYAGSEAWQRDKAFWQAQRQALPAPASLSAAPLGGRAAGSDIWRMKLEMNADAFRRLASHVPQCQPADLALALTTLWLGRLCNRMDYAAGFIFMRRMGSAALTSTGPVLNVLPLAVHIDAQETLADLAMRLAAQLKKMRRHQRYDAEQIVRDSGKAAGDEPLFGPVLNVKVFDYQLDIDGVEAVTHTLATGPVNDLELALFPDETGGLSLEILANKARYDEAELRRHMARLTALLAQFAAAPTLRCGDAEMLSADELTRLTAVNDTAMPLPATTLSALVADQARKTPDAPALADANWQFSYREMRQQVVALAQLLRQRGVKPGDSVAVALPRSVFLTLALHGIVEAGAAWLPLDTGYPDDRLRMMLEDARPSLLIASEDQLARFSDIPGLESLCYQQPLAVADDAPLALSKPDHTAYIIFTSGSTGRPKGVMVGQTAIVNRLLWMQDRYPLSADDVVAQKTPCSFDVSVWEFWWPFIAGARLVMAEPEAHRDPQAMQQFFAHYGVTTTHFVPSMLAAFVASLDADSVAACRTLRRVFCSGEALPTELCREWERLTGAPLHNLYGPTEAAVDVSWYPACGPELAAVTGSSVPIGWPVWNTGLRILDAAMRPVPPGVAGDLYLTGIQLAQGYLGRPDLTASRFIADPFAPGERMYRTGDVARWLANGAVEYLGRSDDQLKIRGQRIELGEIDRAMSALPDVAQAVSHACVFNQAAATGGDARQLVGYLVSDSGLPLDTAALKARLAEQLPPHMVPVVLMQLADLPLSANGKLDRKALPLPTLGGERSGRPPEPGMETLVAAAFSQLLGCEVNDIDADFFALGGHSLLAMRLAAQLSRQLARQVTPGQVMVASTVGKLSVLLAADLSDEQAQRLGLDALLPLRESDGPTLFCFHPASGFAWQFSVLARYLSPRWSITGIQSPRPQGPMASAASLDEVCEHHLQTLLAQQPHGPYYLFGYSLGGTLAQGIAARLRQRGEAVAFLGLLDTWPPETQNWAEKEANGLDPAVLAEIAREREAFLAAQQGQASGELFCAIEANYADAVRLLTTAHSAKFDGKATLFVAEKTRQEGMDPQVVWGPWVGELEVFSQNCAHVDIISPQAFEAIGPVVREILG